MKPHIFSGLSAALLALGTLCSTADAANSFEEAAEHLDLDGSFIGYVDFDDDGRVVGEQLNLIYQKVVEANPQMPPIPLDFPRLFEVLGFGSIRSFGASSTEVEDGLQRNRSVALLEGEPRGLFALYGLEPIPFRAAELAPADATSAVSGQIEFAALRDTIIAMMTEVMGPMGEGMVLQALQQPVPGTDLTGNEIVEALSTKLDFIMSQNFSNPQAPELDMWLSIQGAGPLLQRLEPLATSNGIAVVDTEKGRSADLSPLMAGAPFGLFVLAPSGSDDLVVFTDAEWVASFGQGRGLASAPEYQRVASRLPNDAAFYSYSAGFDAEQIYSNLEKNPEIAAYLPLIRDGVDLVLGDLLAPNATAMFRAENAIVTEQYAEYSYKSLLVGIPAGIGAGIGVGAAIQSMQANAAGDEADDSYDESYDESGYEEVESAEEEDWQEETE